MGTISHAFIVTLFIVTITSLITPNTNAHLHVSSHFPHPYTSPSPSPSPSPKPHHKPGTGHHHPHPHPSASAPLPSPTNYKPVSPTATPPPPAKPPTTTYPTPATPPVKPPTTTYPPQAAPTGGKRKYVAVQGMVYCKSNCTYSGIDTLLGASPLPGAKVVMRCKNSPFLLRKTAKTDKHGYYFLQAPPLITTFGAHKCKVYLAHKPKSGGPCTLASNLNGGASGAYLYTNNTGPPKPLPTFSLFTVGPFVYEPSKCHKY